MKPLRGAVLIALAGAPGCYFTVGWSELATGDAPMADAAGFDASSGDADVEAARGDASDACPAGFLCDDFEGAGTIPSTPFTGGNATVGVDTIRAKTGQKSLHASRPAAPGRGNGEYRALAFPARLKSCELDVFATATVATSLQVFSMYFSPAPPPFGFYQVSIDVGSGEPGNLEEFGDRTDSQTDLYNSLADLPPLTAGKWGHMRIAFDWSSSSVTVNASSEGAFPVERTATFHPPAGLGAPSVSVGMVYESAPDGAWEVFIDNVVCATE